MLYFIVNPAAAGGTATKKMQAVVDRLKKIGAEYQIIYTDHRMHAEEITRDLIASGAKDIISCGGDGTHNEILNGIANSGAKDITMGFLPCGTGNDFMRSAALPIDLNEALNVILAGKKRKVDYIDVGGRKMLCFANSGIDVEVVKLCNAEKRKAKLSYVKNLIKCVFSSNGYNITIKIDDKIITAKGAIVSVLNGCSIASGMKYCSLAKVDDGLLDIVLLMQSSKLRLFSDLFALAIGRFLERKGVKHFQTERAEITCDGGILDIDGELVDKIDFDAKIVPLGLEIFG